MGFEFWLITSINFSRINTNLSYTKLESFRVIAVQLFLDVRVFLKVFIRIFEKSLCIPIYFQIL